jgi:large subunit ribosomal protein L6
MSRIGRLPDRRPLDRRRDDRGPPAHGQGPKGTLTRELHPDMTVSREDGHARRHPADEQKTHKQLHGLTRTLVNNMVVG